MSICVREKQYIATHISTCAITATAAHMNAGTLPSLSPDMTSTFRYYCNFNKMTSKKEKRPCVEVADGNREGPRVGTWILRFHSGVKTGEEENNAGLGMEKKRTDMEDIWRIKVRWGNRGGDKNTRLEEGEELLQQDTESEYMRQRRTLQRSRNCEGHAEAGPGISGDRQPERTENRERAESAGMGQGRGGKKKEL